MTPEQAHALSYAIGALEWAQRDDADLYMRLVAGLARSIPPRDVQSCADRINARQRDIRALRDLHMTERPAA